jgi:hypothetical protein
VTYRESCQQKLLAAARNCEALAPQHSSKTDGFDSLIFGATGEQERGLDTVCPVDRQPAVSSLGLPRRGLPE